MLLLALVTGSPVFAQKNITITGTITGAADPNLVVVNFSNTDIVPENKQETIALNEQGQFSLTIPVNRKYNWIVLANGKLRLDFFAKEGSTLRLTTNGGNFDTSAHFEGNGSELPEYFARATRERGGIMGYHQRTQAAAMADPADYPKLLDSLRKAEEATFRNTRIKGRELPRDFAPYWAAFLQYSVYDAMLHYPLLHEQIKQKSQYVQEIPEALYAVTRKAPPAFNDDYMDLAFYQTYVQRYFDQQLSAGGFPNIPVRSEADQAQMLQRTDSMLNLIYTRMPPKTGEFAAGRIIATNVKGWPFDYFEAKVGEYRKHYPKSANNALLDGIAAEVKRFDPGQPALDFDFTTLEGKKMKLSDLKGKVVYMDFWASWCGPCKGEMPHAKKIKEHFQGKDVVFLYVSIDDKEEAWKRGIEAMDISGVHTRTPGWQGDIARRYQIQSVPSYFLIDKKGNFVTRRTPRPSQSAELISLIEGLL